MAMIQEQKVLGLRKMKQRGLTLHVAGALYNAAELSRSKDKGDQDWIGR